MLFVARSNLQHLRSNQLLGLWSSSQMTPTCLNCLRLPASEQRMHNRKLFLLSYYQEDLVCRQQGLSICLCQSVFALCSQASHPNQYSAQAAQGHLQCRLSFCGPSETACLSSSFLSQKSCAWNLAYKPYTVRWRHEANAEICRKPHWSGPFEKLIYILVGWVVTCWKAQSYKLCCAQAGIHLRCEPRRSL